MTDLLILGELPALDQTTQLETVWIDLGDRELDSGIG